MKNFKSILMILGMFFCVTVTQAQKTNQQKAEKKVEEINQQIISVDKTLALDDAQKKQLIKLQIQKLEEVKKVNTSEVSDEEKELARKKIYKKGYKDLTKIISKEQQAAYKEGKKKKK